MPSIETNRRNFEAAKEQGNIVPVEKSVVVNSTPPIPTYPAAPNANLRTTLPAISVQQPDMQRQWQTGATPQQRIPPTSATSNPIVGAQAASQTIIAIQGGAAGPLLETNNLKNNNQGILNLIQGSGVTLSADPRGGVTITSTSSGDGLIHGDTIWELDSGYTLLRDEFVGRAAVSGNIGELGWILAGTGGNVIAPRGSPFGFPGNGAFLIENNGTLANFQNITLSESSSTANFFMPLFDYPGWKATFVFGFTNSISSPTTATSFLKKSFYVGFGTTAQPSSSGWPARPNIFCGLRYDTDTTAPSIGDSTFKFEVVSDTCTSNTRNNTQGTVVDTGVTPAVGLYRLDIQCVTAGVVTMSLNGSTPQSFTMPTISSGSAVATGNGRVTNNIGMFNPGGAGSKGDCFGVGSKITFSGLVAPLDIFNGVRTIFNNIVASGVSFPLVHADVGANNSIGTLTGYPGVTPIFSFGNDTQAAPTTFSLAAFIDFFSLVWNPGVGGGTGTPNSTHSRYFN